MRLSGTFSTSGKGVVVLLNGEHFPHVDSKKGITTLTIGDGTSINPLISYPKGMSLDDKRTSLVQMFDLSRSFPLSPDATERDILKDYYIKKIGVKRKVFNLDGTERGDNDENGERRAKINTLLVVGAFTNLIHHDSEGNLVLDDNILTMNHLSEIMKENPGTFGGKYYEEFLSEFGDMAIKWNRQFASVEPVPLSVFDDDVVKIISTKDMKRYRDDSVAFLIAWLKDAMAALPDKHFTIIYKNTGNPWALRSFYKSIENIEDYSIENCTFLVL